MPTAWSILIDWDNNGDNPDSEDNVTDRVMSAKWVLGMRVPYEDVADESVLDLILDNQDRYFSPEYTSELNPLATKVKPQRFVRIISNDGTTERIHWVGWIQSVQPSVGKFGPRTIRIVAAGAMQFLKAAQTKIPLQENKRTDEVIAALMREVIFPPILANSWILGRAGYGELGVESQLADTTGYQNGIQQDLEPGKLTLNMAGDNWVREGGYTDATRDSYDVYRAIAEVTAAERGRFFFDRRGHAVFRNRHWLLDDASLAATFTDTMTDMKYTFTDIDQLKNEVVIVCHPRTISTSSVKLWTLGEGVIRVEKNKPREIYISYVDDQGRRVGGRDVTISQLQVDGSVTYELEPNANGAKITFWNTGTSTAFITKCTLQGRKITSSDKVEATSTNVASITDYGRRVMRLSFPSIDDLREAQYIADFECQRRSNPRGLVHAITVMSHAKAGGTNHDNQLKLTIGNRIRVEETQTAHAETYSIIGEAHELVGGTLWKTTWYLESTGPVYPWKLDTEGRSRLEPTGSPSEQTLLAY